MNRRVPTLACVVVMLALGAVSAPTAQSPAAAGTIPRDAAGRPNLQGIWQVHNTAAANLEDHLARHGMPGYAPTQGHIASAVCYTAHACRAMEGGQMTRALFMAKGSLFLGRMTEMADGVSFILEA